jgi:hypothetical protein
MKMSSVVRKALVVGGCIMLVSGVASADEPWLKGTPDEQLKTLAEIQPGLGTVMIEYGNRFTNMYYAAHGGNWGFADYQLKEAREIQEVGETTRPKRATPLKDFEAKYLDPLAKAINAADLKSFDAAFDEAVKGCNACHKEAHFTFIKYELPKSAPTPIRLTK